MKFTRTYEIEVDVDEMMHDIWPVVQDTIYDRIDDDININELTDEEKEKIFTDICNRLIAKLSAAKVFK